MIQLFSILIAATLLTSSISNAEKVTLDFKSECTFVPGQFLLVQTFLKLKGANSRKLYQIQCMLQSKRCFGVDLRVSEPQISSIDLLSQNFDVSAVTVSKTGGTFVYNNVSFTADADSNSVKMKIDFSDRKPPTEETWEGKCR